MDDLPIKALSIRQPWAWAILHAGKDIENRPRRTHYRGRVAIHASRYFNVDDFTYDLENIQFLAPHAVRTQLAKNGGFLRGGIIGSVEISDCVTESDSPWFFGEYGYVLRDPQPCEFIPVKGMLGFFDWRKNLGAS